MNDNKFMSFKESFHKFILDAGVQSRYSVAKARAIRISNLICMTAVVNCLIFCLFFKYLGDMQLFYTCAIAGMIYVLAHAMSFSGFPTAGRLLLLTSGNFAIFYCACAFRGEANFEFFLFSLSATTFMHFSWEEKKYYALIALPALLLLIGDYNNWNFFQASQAGYDLSNLRLLATMAPFFQINMGFFYFLKQSVKFETESIEYLRKLEIEYSKQIQVQKMSSLGEMAGGIAHEINNPLMVIIGTTYQLKKELEKTVPVENPAFARIEKIDTMVQRIVRIIQALRNFSRNSENDPSEQVDIQSVISSTLDLCKERFASNGVELEILGEQSLQISCRPTEISQVLLNLLNNAFDATNSCEKPKVNIRFKKIAEHIEITVEDNGHGIPPEIADKIMQPFFSTKGIGKGTGLGLSISKGLIESNRGTLALIPDIHKTIFKILLPASP